MTARVMIVEAHPGGHRLYYVRLLVEAAANERMSMTVALGASAVDSAEFAAHLGDFQHRFDLVVAPEPMRISQLLRGAREAGFDLVVVPHGDVHLTSLLLSPYRVPLSVLVMQDPRNEYPVKAARRAKLAIKRLVIRTLAVRPATAVHTLRAPGYVGRPDEMYVNDPIDVRMAPNDVEAFRDKHFASGVFWFGLIGVLSERKNPRMVIHALRRLHREDVGLAVVGPIEPESRSVVLGGLRDLESAGIKTCLIERHLTNAEMNAAVCAVDCVVIAYGTHAPPSTLGKSYVLGTRCIIAGSENLRRHADTLGHGLVGPLTAESLSGMMTRSMDLPPLKPQRPPSTDVFASRLLESPRDPWRRH